MQAVQGGEPGGHCVGNFCAFIAPPAAGEAQLAFVRQALARCEARGVGGVGEAELSCWGGYRVHGACRRRWVLASRGGAAEGGHA